MLGRAFLGGAILLSLGLVACGGSEFGGNVGSTTNGGGGNSSDGGASGDGGNGSGTGGAPGGGNPGTGGTGTGGQGIGSGGTSVGGGTGAGGASAGGGSATGGTTGTGGAIGSGGAGGQGATTQWAKDYDQKCDSDYGCSLVTQGEVCGCPGCPNAAIASSAQTEWDAVRAKIDCGPPPPQPVPCPAIDCIQMLASCGDGLCYARQPTYIDGNAYDKSCLLDSDCKFIYTGEVCSSCQCGTAAVNATGYQQYQHDISSVKCTPGPSACDCAPQTAVKCKLSGTVGSIGVCTIG